MKHIVVGNNCVFDKDKMPDVQNTRKDFYPSHIKKVGVRNIEAPIFVWQKDEKKSIQVHATFSSYVELTEASKGVNMSRMGRVIMRLAYEHAHNNISASLLTMMHDITTQLQSEHQSQTAYVKCKFSYPSWTKVYASNLDTVEYVDVIWETIATGTELIDLVTLENVGISLCPCSKEMSLLKNNLTDMERCWFSEFESEMPNSLKLKLNQVGFGAHNQRSHVTVTVQLKPNSESLWFEDLITITDKSFSAPIRAILKREDEKVVGELAYLGGFYDDNGYHVSDDGTGPKFVEDIARDAAQQLDKLLDVTITDYTVVTLNDESIHSRELQAVAVLTAGRNLQ